MTVITVNQEPYFMTSFNAAPMNLDLMAALEAIHPKGTFWLRSDAPGVVRCYNSFQMLSGSPIETTVIMSNQSAFRSDFYDTSRMNLQALAGQTTLQIALRGPNGNAVEREYDVLRRSIPEMQDVPILESKARMIQELATRLAKEFKGTCSYATKYNHLYETLTHTSTLPTKRLSDGPFIIGLRQLIRQAGAEIDFTKKDIRLTNRIQGDYQGNRVELSMLYSDNLFQNPGVCATILSSITEEKCKACVGDICDPKRSYVAYLFSADSLYIVASKLNPKVIPGFTHIAHSENTGHDEHLVLVQGLDHRAGKMSTLQEVGQYLNYGLSEGHVRELQTLVAQMMDCHFPHH